MTAEEVRLQVPDDAEGTRLDRFLARAFETRTRSSLERLIRDGAVLVEGRPAPKPGMLLKPGMRLDVRFPPPPENRPRPEDIPLDVLHEDPHLLAVHKPAGMVVHPGHGRRSGTLVHALLGLGVPLAAAGGAQRPGIVHRLDKDTSGVLLIAKDDPTHRALSRAFARREIDKRYVALVWGHPQPAQGRIERGIGRSRNDPTRMAVSATRGRSRNALTVYETRRSFPGFSLLDIDLRTGRTHQIRVHLQSIHHPIVGDARYGGAGWRGVQDPVTRKLLREFGRLALHARELALLHPATGRRHRFRAPLPPEFARLIRHLEGKS